VSGRRHFIYEALEAGHADTPFARLVDLAMIGLIVLNVVAVIIESVPDIGSRHFVYFDIFETISVAIFTVEYVLRVWSAPEHPGEKFKTPVAGRIRYMLSPLALIDLIVILPFYLSMFTSVDLRVLRVFRLLRVVRLTRYSTAMTLLLQVLREESKNIGAALFVLIILMVFAASAVYLAEHQAQPDSFGSIPEAMWWAVITMTTVGYGDVVPITAWGKVFGSLIGIVSVGMVALPAGILASGFNEALHRRRRRFDALIDDILDQGPLDEEGRQRLRYLQHELGLNDAEAASFLMARYHHREIRNHRRCPHCGKPLGDYDT